MGRTVSGDFEFNQGFTCADLQQALEETGALPERLIRRYGSPTACYRGATAVVFYLSESRVLKVVPACKGAAALESARREIDFLKRLKGFSRVVELVDYEVVPVLMTCMVERRYTPLSEHIRSMRLMTRDVCDIGADLCEALIVCREKGIFHLDLQPRNLFMDGEGRAVLGDFGVSLWREELQDAGLRGTRAYMAPEVCERREYSERSEIYSLGLVLYCLLNGGEMPFSGGTASAEQAIATRLRGEKLPSLFPDALAQAVEKACAFEPEQRWDSFEQFRDALAQASMDDENRVVPMSGALLQVPTAYSWGNGAPEPRLAFDADLFGTTLRVSDPGGEAGADVPPFDADDFATSRIIPQLHRDVSGSMPPCDGDRLGPKPPWGASAADTIFGEASAGASTFDDDLFSMTQSPDGGAPGNVGIDGAPKLDRVQFSAIAPKKLTPEEYGVVQVVMYEEAFRGEVDDIIAASEEPVNEKRSGFVQVARQTHVRVVLESPQFEIEDNVCEQVWVGGFASFDFAVLLPAACKQAQIMFRAVVYFDGVPATRLMFTSKQEMDDGRRQLDVFRKDILSAFISYASQDRRHVATIIQGMRKIRPDLDVFFDVDSLRSGEIWRDALEHEILKRDMLYLCWSKYARDSKWVEMEWRLALDRKGEDFIEPLPLEGPDTCPPPEELSRKHFNDSLLFIINRE